ncbi:hypothetical protein [Marinifilum flexuosum]|uniref:Uncharacterized protein n=1 Tax=Marinifilum flexuosum TaxID=1117708 RepID=A0A419WMN9_9BACT|nr:hypothetical protein [Marinifilum flexuosum]RKD96745.1 hypothetical protein BXY64_3691 [Marinifilum flexuosum]
MSKKRWSADELQVLKKHYVGNAIEEVLKLLPGRSKDAVQWKASQLGLLIRDGKQRKANKKIIANVTEEHYKKLGHSRNHSRIVREALDLYFKEKEE